MDSPSLWWSTAIWEITAHQSIDSDCGVHLSMPRHGGKSNRCPRGETAEREKGTKALHSSATHRQCKQREQRSHGTIKSNSAVPPAPLAQGSWLQALSPAWASFAVLQKQGREKPDRRSQEESFHIPTLPEFPLGLHITVITPPHLGFSLTPSSSTCILQQKNFSGRPLSILSDHCFTTVHFCGKTTLTAANVSRRCPKVCLESHS